MLRVLMFLMLACTGWMPAVAETHFKPMPADSAARVYDANTLRPEQIRDCLLREQSLLKRVEEMRKQEKILTDQASRVQQMGKKLKALEPTIDPADHVAMDDFRFRFDVYRHAEEQYNQHATRFNSQLATLKDDQHRYNSECVVGKQYYEDDYRQAIHAATVASSTIETAAKSGSGTVYLQLGAFRQQESIDALLRQLADEHLSLSQHETDHGLHIVRAGPFSNGEEAMRVKQRLLDRYGINAIIRKR